MFGVEEPYDSTTGPVLRNIILAEETGQRLVRLNGLIDTGATYCAIPPDIVRSLGLTPFGQAPFWTPSGHMVSDVYFVRTGLTDLNGEVFWTMPIGFARCEPLTAPYSMLVGRNLLRLGKLVLTGDCFEFTIPTNG